MSQIPTTSANDAIEQLRAELSASAARTQRANRPQLIVIIAALGLMSALVFLFLSWRAKSDAETTLRRNESFAKSALESAARLRALKAKATQNRTADQGADVLTQLRSRLQDTAELAGVKQAKTMLPRNTRSNRSPTGKSVQNLYDYEVRDESLPALLTWVERSTTDVQGLEVSSISILPEATQWTMRVTFARWEKVDAS